MQHLAVHVCSTPYHLFLLFGDVETIVHLYTIGLFLTFYADKRQLDMNKWLIFVNYLSYFPIHDWFMTAADML